MPVALPPKMSSTKNDSVEVNAVVGQPQACCLTSTVLMQALIDSGYGERVAIFRTVFHYAEDGSALCNACGMQIGQHADRSDPVMVVTESTSRSDNEVTFPAPDCTIQQYSRNRALQHFTIGTVTSIPLHWVGAAWYAPFVDFVSHSRDEGSYRVHALLHYRCNIKRCGKLFEVEGPLLDRQKNAPIGPVSLKTMGSGETIEAHMGRIHGLKHLPARRFATRLFDCCKDPAFATTCCIAYCSTMIPCEDCDRGVPTCNSIGRVFSSYPTSLRSEMVRGISFVHSAQLGQAQCACPLFFGLVIDWSLGIMPLFGLGFLVASIVTLFGFPCNSDSLPPLLCWPCYHHRRQLVQVLGADETPFQSRVKATCCCYCSEVQVWRELKASGVWAGLLCSTASEEDREDMSASAVRQRYSVDGAYAVRATSVEGERLLQGVRKRILDGPAPNLCYGMK
jgi:hypothetical protein